MKKTAFILVPLCLLGFSACSSRQPVSTSVTDLEPLIETLQKDLQEIQIALPLYNTRVLDDKAAELFIRTKDEKTYESKKALLEEALAIEGVSDAVRFILQKELDSLVPPPPPVAAKPRTSFQAVSIPKQMSSSKSRYSVNMSEMMRTISDAGVTEDPFKQ